MKVGKYVLLIAMLFVNVAGNAQGVLLISELLYQPRSGEAEYVELYNNGSSAVNLSDYHVVRWVGDSLGKHYTLPEYSLGPHDYVALTKDAASVVANYDVRFLSKLVECSLPTYPNDGGSVIISTADSIVVDRFDYSPSLHSRLLRNKAGVSLERRSFDRTTGEAENWFSASSMAGYGTPGYENSQSTEYLVEENAFEFSSTLISPDGDGYQDKLEIAYRLDDGDLAAKVEILDAHGRVVCNLLNNGLLGTHGTLEWDGRDSDRMPLPQGQYIVQITIYDNTGTQQYVRRPTGLIAPSH